MEIKKEKYEKIELSNKKKSFRKKCCSYMSNFNKERDLSQDNSNIKCNQINVIEKYGILYFFNEDGIYFLDNSKMKVLLELNKDISYSDLFFLKCKNIFKVVSLEDGVKTFLIICTKKDPDVEDSQSFIIYIDIEEFIEKINKQKNIYDTKIIEIIEKKEKNFKSGLVRRELEELDRNIELNEDGEYPEDVEFEPKKETLKEKEKKIKEEKEKILIERDEIFQKNYEKAAKYEPFKIIYIEDNFKEIIILDEDNYVILYENGDIIFYNNYKKIRLIQKDAQLISYNKETSIFLIISHDFLYILKENNNFETLKEISKFPIEDIISDEKNILIFCENIYNYIILYAIQNSEEPDSSDNLIFIELDEQMKQIIKIYIDKEYFYPDDYELSGIAYYSQLKRTIISSYDKDLGIYMIINKHMNKLNKYYIFEENKDNNNIYDLFSINIDDEFQVNSFVKKIEENEESEEKDEENEEENEEEEEDEYAQKLKDNNSIIGVSLIKFKFDGYDKDQEFIGGEMINSPYLLFVLGFYGGIRIHYSSNEKLLKDKTDFFTKAKNISNKVLEISINEEMVEIEKEKYKNENIKKEKSFTELYNLKQLNQRNIFLHGLDNQIKENLEYFKNLAIPEKTKFELMELQKIANNPNIKEIQNSIDLLINEAKDLFEKEEENQKFIDDNKILIENFKNVEINLKNDIKIIEENKNKTKELKFNINTPINELLTHPKVKNFFTEEKITDMIKIFNKYKNNYNLYENHINLISGMFVVNDNLIKQIEECKTKYNSIKDACKFSKNRKDIENIMANLQNSIFLLYMRVFEQFFFNLEQFEINNLSKEYLYLNQLKINNAMSIEESKNGEEEEEEKINRSHARFVLREEEDIDEGNNNSISSNELEENIISTSQKKNKIITFSKNINNNSINNSINNSLNKSSNNEKEQNLIVRNNNKVNYRDITMNNDNYLVNREAYNTINKIFGTNLIKEKEASKKNYLIDVLNNFEGRITYYNEETEKDYCTDADELFQEFLEDDEKIKERQNKKRALKEMNEKKKENILKNLEDSISKQKLEKSKIEKELSLIDEKNKKLIIEKEKENTNLKQKLEELEKMFEDNKKEREKEKKKLIEEIEKNKKDEKQKLINEQNNANSKIKSMEEEIKNFEKKLKEEENKRIEAEEKVKKLEEEKKNINISINSNNNNNSSNINNNSNDNNNNNLINFTFHENNEQNKNEEEKKKPNENNVSLFQSNNPKPEVNIFAQKINDNENSTNIQNKGNGIFDSIQNLKIKKEEKAPTNDIKQNLFFSSSNNNPKDIFKANTNKTNINIFNNSSIQTLGINNKASTSTNNQNQNEQKKMDNNIFSKLSTNNNEGNSSTSFFKNINFGPAIQNNINNNNSPFNQPLFGQHSQFGNQQNNNNININNNNNKSISLNFNSGGYNASNSISPFASLGVGNNNMFRQQPQINNNNNNNKNEFF